MGLFTIAAGLTAHTGVYQGVSNVRVLLFICTFFRRSHSNTDPLDNDHVVLDAGPVVRLGICGSNEHAADSYLPLRRYDLYHQFIRPVFGAPPQFNHTTVFPY